MMHPTAALLALRGMRVYRLYGENYRVAGKVTLNSRVLAYNSGHGVGYGWQVGGVGSPTDYIEIHWDEIPDRLWDELKPERLQQFLNTC